MAIRQSAAFGLALAGLMAGLAPHQAVAQTSGPRQQAHVARDDDDDDDRKLVHQTKVAPKAKDHEDDDDGDDDDGPKRGGEIVVTAHQLDNARARVSASLGASTYSLTNDVIEKRPSGEAANLVNVLLQMPGVSQGGSGELHVRGTQGLQYRINNVIIPDGFTDLADTLRARFAEKIELVTGALPAQYGLQTGGVVNITTKSGVYGHGGEVELSGGTLGRFEGAFDAMGSLGETNYYVSGSYLRSDAGLSAPDGSTSPLHDHTDQIDGFAYFDRILDAQSRLSLIVGVSNDAYDLPHARGINAATDTAPSTFQRPLTIGSTTAYPAEAWGGHERVASQYGILSYQRSAGALTMQLSATLRASALAITPDMVGDVLFTGLAQAVSKHNLSTGLQAEGLYELSPAHRLRGGITVNWSRDRSRSDYAVLPVDATGRPISTTLLTLPGMEAETRHQLGAYLEDEWLLGESLTINAGLRFDSTTNSGGGDALSPRINAVWKPTSGTTAHLGYARYFVPASEDTGTAAASLLAGTTGAWPTRTETPAKAERDDDIDLGVEQKLEDVTLGVDAYWRHARNLLDAVRIGSTVLSRPFNYERGKAWGVELTATYTQGPLSIWGNLAVAQIEGCTIIAGQAPFTAAQLQWIAAHDVPTNADQRVTGSLGAAWHSGRLRLSADGVLGSGLPRTVAGAAPNGARMPANAQVNLAATYRVDGLAHHPLTIRLDVLNALGARYALQDGSSLAGGTAQWGSPRGIYAGVEQAF
ncbi:MAG: TonB-dependent receptor [Sphingomonadales bacterium]|nr:TonB-dependent receptor [Sphingomonadales bacterium]MDE2170756.1 TonB-dependent receptor [Sphingomonadales bacterium]